MHFVDEGSGNGAAVFFMGQRVTPFLREHRLTGSLTTTSLSRDQHNVHWYRSVVCQNFVVTVKILCAECKGFVEVRCEAIVWSRMSGCGENVEQRWELSFWYDFLVIVIRWLPL